MSFCANQVFSVSHALTFPSLPTLIIRKNGNAVYHITDRLSRPKLAIAASPIMGEFPSKQSTAMKLFVPLLSLRQRHQIKPQPQALRLVLNSLSTSASRYGRYITPLLSLSIDFYVRLFIQVRSAPIEVKRAARFADYSHHAPRSC
jgi:hypothetical protein